MDFFASRFHIPINTEEFIFKMFILQPEMRTCLCALCQAMIIILFSKKMENYIHQECSFLDINRMLGHVSQSA